MTSSCEADMCTVDLFWGTRKDFNGFESQQAVFVSQTSSERRERKGGSWTHCIDLAGSYLSWHSVFTEESFIVYGKDWGIIIYVQHRDERDAFSNLGRVLWKRRERRESPAHVTAFSKLSLTHARTHFNSASTLMHWRSRPNYGILLFLMCFN